MAHASREPLDRSQPEFAVRLAPPSDGADRLLAQPLVALVSSRLGHDPALHWQVGRRLSHSMLQCRLGGSTALVADRSAIAPWALRAAELFATPTVLLCCDAAPPSLDDLPPTVAPMSPILTPGRDGAAPAKSRDQVVIEMADRVDALFVRRSGRIERWLGERIRRRGDASTRVAVTARPVCAAKSLIALGAVGWWIPHEHRADHAAEPARWLGGWAAEGPTADGRLLESRSRPAARRWDDRGDRWLLHCTRGCPGPWPGQSERQHLDAMLLGDRASAERGPLQSLRRILRSRRLVASAIATTAAHPVVCFSSLPLRDLLSRRRFRPHLQRWDYEPFGVALRLKAAAERGVQPVIYGDPADRRRLPDHQRYRFQAKGRTYDWTEEREWRAGGDVDLTQFAASDVQVFVPSAEMAASLQPVSPWPVSVAPLR